MIRLGKQNIYLPRVISLFNGLCLKIKLNKIKLYKLKQKSNCFLVIFGNRWEQEAIGTRENKCRGVRKEGKERAGSRRNRGSHATMLNVLQLGRLRKLEIQGTGGRRCLSPLQALNWIIFCTIVSFFRLGAHRRVIDVGTEQDIVVSKVITHPSYHKPSRYSHDIALLKLSKPASLNQ